MKRILFSIFTLLLIAGCGSDAKGGSGGKDGGEDGGDNNGQTPSQTVRKVDFGDPFIMLYDGTYYLYGTDYPTGIEVYTSDDMITWRRPGDGYEHHVALAARDSYGDKWFWAPEVYHVGDKFYMYYSAEEHICVAVADSPLGPFKQKSMSPMIAEKAIDNSLFIDDDGTPYLYFDRFEGGLNIWVAELEKDLQTIKTETLTPCIAKSDDAWENIWPIVNEGCFVIKHEGVYYMTYSANSYESHDYAVGYATAESPLGPWTKYTGNPILRRPGNLVGVGHSAMFTDKDGQLRIVFHAHKSNTEIHPRNVYISKVNFIKFAGKNVMTIDTDYITAGLKYPTEQ